MYSVPIACHDDAQYVSLPIYYLCTHNFVHEDHNFPLFPFNDDNHSPTIATMTTTLTTYDPFLHPVINTQGQVNINNINELQHTILDSYPTSFF